MSNDVLPTQSSVDQTAAHELARLQKEWWAFLVLGILLILGGAACISYPFITSIGVMIFLGVALMVSGVSIIILAFWTGKWSAFMLQILIGLVYVVSGFLVADAPVASAAVFTLMLAGFFIVGGLFRIVFALSERFSQWGWVLMNGIATLIVGLIIFKSFRQFAEGESGQVFWIIGLLVGIEMIFYGWTWVMLSLAVRNIPASEDAASNSV